MHVPADAARIVVGENVHRTTLEEACQLLGHDPDDVAAAILTPTEVMVYAYVPTERTDAGLMTRPLVLHRHIVR